MTSSRSTPVSPSTLLLPTALVPLPPLPSLLQALAAEEAAAAVEQQRLADEAARRLQIKAEKAALVAPEVSPDSPEPHTSLLFRLPDGSKLGRRFRLGQRVQEMFDFLDSEVGEWQGIGGREGQGKERAWSRQGRGSETRTKHPPPGRAHCISLGLETLHRGSPLHLAVLRCAVLVQGAGGLWPNTYKLVLQYPRRVLEPSSAQSTQSLQEAGFDTSQQAVFVEHME